MKRFLTFVVALAMTIPMMAIGRNDGSTKANAIDFDWEAPMTHTYGTKWYRVDLAPLYEEESPALNLFLANKDAFNETHTSLKATVAGQTDEKSFTIGPKQQKVWSANATMLVRLKQTEIYLTLTSDGPVLMSARVFEAQDLDETCKDALNFSWASGITKPAGVPVWYKVNIKDAKANTDKDVCVVVTNNGTGKLTLYAGQSLDCPSSGVTKRTIEVEAGQTFRDTIPNSMLNGVAFDELYVSLENDQPIAVKAEYAARPAVAVLPADTGQYKEKIVPDTALHKYDTTLLSAGQTYYFKYDVAKLNALKKYEPEFTFKNVGTEAASVDRKMSFELPAYVAQGNVLELAAGEESIEVLTKNTLLGLDAAMIYVKITPNKDIKLLSRFKHVREGKACKTNIDYNWEDGNRQDTKTTQWYAVDLTTAKTNTKDVVIYVENQNSSASAHVKASMAFSCPYIDLQEISRTIAAGDTAHRRIPYSTYAMMTDTVWIGIETDQDIKFWATLKDAEKKAEVDTICLHAETFDWEQGVMLKADTTVWYRIDMTQVRDLAAKFPTVFVQNLSSTEAVTITAELSLECPDSIANESRSKTIAANGSYSKQISRNMFENIKANEIYLKVYSTQDISLQIRLTEEAEGASCSSAIPFNWVSGNTQKANENLWYSVDLREVMKSGNDIILHIENKANETSKGVAQLIYECPTASAPSIQDFKLAALAEKAISVQNSAFETVSDSIVYVNLQATTSLRFWVEQKAAEPFDTIYAEDVTLKVLQWDSLYTQTEDTAWYLIPQSEIDLVRNREDKVKPVAHLYNLGDATTLKAEAAFAFPIVKTMMTKSQKLKAGQHFSDTIPAGTFEQILKKDSIIVRITRPVGSGDFKFRAELVKAFNGNTRNDALPIRMGKQYTQGPNTEMWYKLNTKELKLDSLYNKQLWVSSKNAGKGDAEVTLSVYEGLLSNEDLLEAYGLGDFRTRTIKKGTNKSHNFPAQAVYGVGDGEFYILVRTTDSLVFESKFAGEYAPVAVDPKQAQAQLLVPNVYYTVPADGEDHWYMVCLPYMQNNYVYTDASKLEYELNGTATIEGTFTFQDNMDCAMPVRQRTINKEGGYHHGTKPVRELIEKAIKKAGYTFDFSATAPSFIDSLLHRYVTKDSITAYIRLKSTQELKVRLFMEQTTGDQCTHPMMFDWEHGNVNPAGNTTWYMANMDSLFIPDTCDLRLHIDNWGTEDNNIGADLYFDCGDDSPTVSKTYTIVGGGKDSLDIDRDFLDKLGWAPMSINYNSSQASHIWAELIPNAVRDTLRDTIVANVCLGESYLDTITNVEYDINQYMTWYDTVTFQDGVTMKDSITLFQIHPIVKPEVITVDSMNKLGASPLLVQGMQLFVDSSNAALQAYYKALSEAYDTIMNVDTVYWAKPVYKEDSTLNDKKELALDLDQFYPKTQMYDTLLLVIKDTTNCNFTLRKDVVFPLELFKYVTRDDTICPPAPAQNPDTLACVVLVPDTLNRPRQIDTIVTFHARVMPKLYTKAELKPIELPVVTNGQTIVIPAAAIPSLIEHFAEDATDTTMEVTAAKWQVLNGADWQDDMITVPQKATLVTMRYIIDTQCGVQDTSVNIDFELTPSCDSDPTSRDDAEACDSYTIHWGEGVDDETVTNTGNYSHTFTNVAGCDSVVSIHVTIYKATNETIPVTACDEYYWEAINKKITTTGLYTHQFTSIHGCDSTVTMNVTINKSTATTAEPVEACDEYYWAEADTTIKDPGTHNYTHRFPTVYGCDSIVTLQVTINQSYNVTATPVNECNLYYWAAADTTITTEGSHDYTHKFTSIHGCDSVVTVNVTIKGTSYVDTLEVKAYYGYRIIMINRNQINQLDGWADLDSLHYDHPEYVNWYKVLGATPDKNNDKWVGNGYYYTLPNGEPLPAGDQYYAYIDIPATAGATCGSIGMTKVITIGSAALAPALVPTLARPGENIKVINLNPAAETTIRIYSTDGVLQGTYTTTGEDTFILRAGDANGFYLVELSDDSMKSTLRYIVK